MPVLDSIVVSIPACHAGDQGSIPCRGEFRSQELKISDHKVTVNKKQENLQAVSPR